MIQVVLFAILLLVGVIAGVLTFIKKQRGRQMGKNLKALKKAGIALG